MTPLTLPDYAVLCVLSLARDRLTLDRVTTEVASPPSGPGVSLSSDVVRRVLVRLEARGLIDGAQDRGWQLTQRGRMLWASKGSRFTM
ncbi:hypothetical protein [Nocardia sp. NPDC057668]|uniref:hypothetical protein n=1 Tax=Nocardia sp. NPDC057668 TaxID=3346202 RepID=UPI00366FB932